VGAGAIRKENTMRISMKSMFLVPVLSMVTACATSPERHIRPQMLERQARPNILIIMTDDQGYSDVGYNGNPVLQTPRIDALARSGVVFDQFYAQPVCSPSRAALLTGRHAMRLGILDTEGGNAILSPDEVTIAEALQTSGYRTGMFGKWHLGDNAPSRPQEQGFERVLTHVGGMIGMPYNPPQGRSYFDPILIEDGEDRRFEGYAPDIFTDAAVDFMVETAREGRAPFFAFLSLNTPHHPLTVPDAFADPYRAQGLSEETARYYGMITNIDHNVGRVMDALDAVDALYETIIVFVGDNGTSSLHRQSDLWEAGLRGRKTDVYENGIRVPMILRLPEPTAAVGVRTQVGAVEDIMPTLLDLADVTADVEFDGVSLATVASTSDAELPERDLFFQFHRGNEPVPYRNIAVRRGDYKLVQPVGRGREAFTPEAARFELYNLAGDSSETTNLAADQPDRVRALIAAYDDWLAEARADAPGQQVTWIGDDRQPVVTLSRQDWIGAGLSDGENGHYALEVRTTGRYRLTFRWSELLNATRPVTIEIGDRTVRREILSSEMEARIEEIQLAAGPLRLQAWVTIDGRDSGFEFIEIEKLDD
jgi:arylsulfatase A